MKINIIIVILILLFSLKVLGQTNNHVSDNNNDEISKLSKKEKRKNQSKFIGITMGISKSNLRDFATSPLIYKGPTGYFSATGNKISQWGEIKFGFEYTSGNYTATFGEQVASSKTSSLSLYYSQLYQWKKLSTEKWNFKVGGEIFATGNLRGNYSLQNNGRGIESFHSLLASAKITRDLSRKEIKNKKFLFIKYKLRPVKRNLSFRFNIGLINSYYRNGFIYANQSEIVINTNTLEGYKFHIFKGEMLSSSLNYTQYMKNKNALQISYIWRAYTTNEKVNDFEMAMHTIKFTFLFNTNNK